MHFININSPDSLFCLIVFVYHRLFCFLFLSCPTEMSSSVIKSKNFSKAALQPDSIFTTDLCFLLSVLHFLMAESGSDSPASLELGVKNLFANFSCCLLSSLYRCGGTRLLYQMPLNSESCSQAACDFVFFISWFKASFMLFFTFYTMFLVVPNAISKMW